MRCALPSAALALALLAGCGSEEPAALRVDDLGFSASMLGAMGEEEQGDLADIAALGLALREGRVDSLLTLVSERVADRTRLANLPYLLGASATGVGEDSLRSLYARDPEWELDVRHVVRLVEGNASQAERREQRGIADEVRRRAVAGEDFAGLAARYSEEPGAAERGGKLEPGRQGTWVEPFWQAAAALQPGEVSPVVETMYGYHVLRLDDRRPVPFEEADRGRVLRQAVPGSAATAAMEAWASSRPPVAVTAEAVRTGRAVATGEEVPSDEVLASGEEGTEYTVRDLALTWAGLDAAERDRLLAADEGGFGSWLENDAREVLWARVAERMGAPPQGGVARDTLQMLRGSAARWESTFGLTEDLGEGDLKAAALRGVVDRGQEARIARMELRALRPLLRQFYPLTLPAESSGASSSSEMRKSESTG